MNESVYYSAINNVKQSSEATEDAPQAPFPSEDPEEFPVFKDVDLASSDLPLPVLQQTSTIRSEEELKPEFNLEEDQSSQVEVQAPSKVGEGWLNSYYQFPITSSLSGETFSVKRRFNDLVWLNQALLAKHRGVSVPRLPPKKTIMDSKFLKTRRESIQQYLSVLLSHPILSKSEPLLLFLTSAEFEKEKNNLTVEVEVFKYTDFEDVLDQLISKVQARLSFIFEMKILPFSKELALIESHLRVIEIPTYALASGFNSLAHSEYESNKSMRSMSFPHSALFYQTNIEHTQGSNSFLSANEKISKSFWQMNIKLEGLRQAFDGYKSRLAKYNEIESLIDRKMRKQRANDHGLTYVRQIEDAQTQLEKLTEELETTEHVLRDEYKWFQENREEQIEGLVDDIFKLQNAKYSFENEFWLDKKHIFFDNKF